MPRRSESGARRRRALPALAAAALLLAACGTPRPEGAAALLDPTTLERTGKPNDRLICPPGACRAPADAAPRRYPLPPARLLAAWRAVILAQPRTRIVAYDEGAGQLVAEQRSLVFRFVDTIAVKVLPLDGGATYAAYSRSNIGYGDLGVNKARLRRWTDALDRRAGGA